ncbi:MAG: isoprenylcysteine carboxylmethyltransferase family protein [Deltaproteobacteria bacterium]|jgi:protein-S-isoprenylcysteine O-methyltransferase Ste14|nr:isoprenylcysteine carboxylmethyltransferase family protein [Deltaproteobacteria bacterium]MBW2534453.1 isoprenylcysteine carboxylmethyltransferase family protein [Deltaproteobacteria bacterium]
MHRDLETFQLAALAAFTLLFIGRTLQLRVTGGVRVVTMVRGKPWREAALELLFLVAFPLWLLDVTWHGWIALSSGASPLELRLFEPGWLRVPGALLEAAAVLLFAASLRSFGSSWRVGVDRSRPGELITRGVFALSRNPIFLAMDLFFVGAALMTGRVIPLLFAVIAPLGFHRQILVEERFLAQRYGHAYREYSARVGRYLGRRSSADGGPAVEMVGDRKS